MDGPIWLTRTIIDVIHSDQIRQHGGQPGVRDDDLVESALASPHQRWSYDPNVDIPLLAALYCFGLIKNHGYVDGNKRVGFMAMYVFLALNGVDIVASEPEVVRTMVQVADGSMDETSLAAWIRVNASS